jgi:hypothetical protein
MEWLFASLMGVGYFGKAHLIWDDGKDRERQIFTALMRNEPIFLYSQGTRPTPTAEGYCWRLLGEHPSLSVYQLQVEVEGKWGRSIAIKTRKPTKLGNIHCQNFELFVRV